MQRKVSVLLASLVTGLCVTGCPEKKVEKEPPAPTQTRPVDRNGSDDKAAEEEHGDEADERAADEPKDDKRARKRRPDKKEQAGEEKDQGGW